MHEHALAAHRDGNLPEAALRYRTILCSDPSHFDALHLLGVVDLQRGDHRRAEALIARAMKIHSGSPSAHFHRGAVLASRAQIGEADNSYRRAVVLAPDYAEAFIERGKGLARQDRRDEALKSYGRALALRPTSTPAWIERGNLLAVMGRREEAIAGYRRAVSIDPAKPGALSNLGNILAAAGRLDQALTSYDRALRVAPDHVDALNNRGNALKDLGRGPEAMASYRRALALAPDGAGRWGNAGELMRTGGAEELALAFARRAVALDPADPRHHDNHGFALDAVDRHLAALAAMRRAIALDPLDPRYTANPADPLLNLGDLEGVHRALRRALAIAANFSRAYFILAAHYMLKGQLPAAWHHYERRFEPPAGLPSRPFDLPTWDGGRLNGKLLVWGEQGLGDELIFGSMLPDLAASGAQVVVEIDRRLQPIFARALPSLEFVGREDPPAPRLRASDIVAQVAMASLARFLRPSSDSFKRTKAYLTADRRQLDRAKTWLSGLGPGPKVGIAWRSARRTTAILRIHTDLVEWGPILATPGVHFVNMQYGEFNDELDAAEKTFGVTIHRHHGIDLFNDIEGVLGLASGLDLMISTGTTAYTPGAAAGVETWLLYPHSDYYFLGQDHMPWFERTRGFLRRPGETWDRAIGQLARALRDRAWPSGRSRE